MKEVKIQLKDYQVVTRYAQELEADNKALKKENKALKESMNELLELLKSFGSWTEAYEEIQNAIQKAEALKESK